MSQFEDINLGEDSDDSIWKKGVVLSFDLVVKELRKYFSKDSPELAYKVIKAYLLEQGFKHLRDSDYINPEINRLQAVRVIYYFSEMNKCFPFCLRKLVISPMVTGLDVSEMIIDTRDIEWGMKRVRENAGNETKKKGK